MKLNFKIDNSKFKSALKDIDINANELRQIEGAGAAVLVNGMRMRVPVDTAATKNSVMSHIIESTSVRVVDEVGPETNYAPYIEFGIESKPAYPIQPFVRPAAFEDFHKVIKAIDAAFSRFVSMRWK